MTGRTKGTAGPMKSFEADLTQALQGPLPDRAWVRLIGQQVFTAAGNTSAMVDIAERVTESDRTGKWASIIDHAWSGIGEGADRWAA